MKPGTQWCIFFLLLTTLVNPGTAQELEWAVGLSSNRNLIRAQGIQAGAQPAATVLYVAGLTGNTPAGEAVRAVIGSYAQLAAQDRLVNLIAIPLANPDSEQLSFPPTGNAYAEDPASNGLWRWIGVHAPDLVIIAGEDPAGLAMALEGGNVTGFGSIPVQQITDPSVVLSTLANLSSLEKSPARIEAERRLDRSPEQLAEQLAESYGHDFSTPAYVPGMSLIGRMRLGQTDEVALLIQNYLDDGDINVSNASLMAGQLVFAEFAERTGNESALRLAQQAADLAFDEQGRMLEAMPFHSEMSDSVFMVTPLLAKVGKLTGDEKYFDMAVRHLGFMQNLLLRDDGLYRHSPLADVAWSRGNAFPALGLALSLSDIPESYSGYELFESAFVQHMEALRPYQDIDGMWHEVIDYGGSFAELTTTAMIGIAMKRGIDLNLLSAETYQPMLSKIWDAVRLRTSLTGEFIDACTSTGKLTSLDAYLDRFAIFGRDDRAGGMVMNFANEMAGNY